MLRLFKLILPMKKKVIAMLLSSLLTVFGTLYIPTLTASIVNDGIIKGDIDRIWEIGLLMMLTAIITALFSIWKTYLSSDLSSMLGRNIRNKLFRKVQSFSSHNFNRFGTASLITRTTSDVNVIQQSFSAIVEMLLPAPFMAVAGLVLAFSKDKTLSLIIIGAMGFVLLFIYCIGKKAIPYFGRMQKMLDRINTSLRESITGVRVIRAFHRTENEKAKADTNFTAYAQLSIRANKLFALALPLIMLIMNISTVLIIWFGGQKAAAGVIQIGDIMTIVEYAMITLMYLVMAGMVFIMIPRAQTSAGRINAVLNHPQEAMENTFENRNAFYTENGTAPIVEMNRVCFQYPNAEEATLEDISFQLRAGETLAIIGSTGSGKSSIAKLLLKFFPIQSGEIRIHGRLIESISDTRLRNMIGYVPQKAFLFSGTIADNLRHGKKYAGVNELQKACETAQAREFIEQLKDGYEARVAQGGDNFSGGQKQRIAIARALIRQPEIYIFDDSFSALDYKTEARLSEALKEETKHSAVIIIAQRVSSIMKADNIMVLDEGRAVGLGTHRELLDSCTVYQQIAASQLSKEELT